MAESTFELREGEPTTVVLSGHIDRALIDALAAAVQAWQPATPPSLLIDLRGAEDFDPDARLALVDVHKAMRAKAGRRAYLASRSRLRGMSLWIMHMAGDVEGRALGTLDQVTRWFGNAETRIDRNLKRLGADSSPPRALDGSNQGKLTFAERMGAAAIGWVTSITDGYWPDFTREMVRTYGLDGLKTWGNAVGAAVQRVKERYGEETAQGLFSMAAVWNGCSYCMTGHMYALNIFYFKRTGELFPIDEREMTRWYTLTDEKFLERFLERVAADEFAELRRLVQRQWEIRVQGAAIASEPDDEFLLLANAAFDLINECSIVVEASKVPPMAPGAAKARGAQRAYAQKRGRTRELRLVDGAAKAV